jgi:hypothetical protein
MIDRDHCLKMALSYRKMCLFHQKKHLDKPWLQNKTNINTTAKEEMAFLIKLKTSGSAATSALVANNAPADARDMAALTTTSANYSASISTPVVSNAPLAGSRTRPRIVLRLNLRERREAEIAVLHLNPRQRREAEIAAQSLERVQARLERHRRMVDGRAASESNTTLLLINEARAAIRTFKSISHPGDRARCIYEPAKRLFDGTIKLLVMDMQRQMTAESKEAEALDGYESDCWEGSIK